MSIITILLIIASVIGFFSAGIMVTKTNDGSSGVVLALFSSLVFGLTFIYIIFVTEMDAYKQGQIDALSGENIEYKLQKQPDGSTVWVSVKKKK